MVEYTVGGRCVPPDQAAFAAKDTLRVNTMDIDRILESMSEEERAEIICGEANGRTRAVRVLPSLKIEYDGFKRSGGASFPSAVAIACGFDADLAYAVGKEEGKECCACGVHLTARVPRLSAPKTDCGDRYRYLSESEKLTHELSRAFADGVQSTGVGANVRFDGEADELCLALEGCKAKALTLGQDKFALAATARKHGYTGAILSVRGDIDDRAQALKCGIDLSVESGFDEPTCLSNALGRGDITQKDVDESARRVLALIDETYDDHEFDLDGEERRRKAVSFAAECAVLVKNDGILPLSGDGVTVCEKGAAGFFTSGEEGGEEKRDSLIDAFKADRRVKLVRGYEEGEDFSEEALEATYPDEPIVVVLGAYEADCPFLKRDTALPEEQLVLVERLADSGRGVVAVVVGGGSVDLKRVSVANAVIFAPYLGDGAGEALKRIICGEVSPCGRLCEDFVSLNGEEREVVYPFGHGLTYGQFVYGEPKAVSSGITLEIRNDGRYSAAEVVQVYDSGSRLVAYEKVRLRAGQSRSVTLKVDPSDLKGRLFMGASRLDLKYEISLSENEEEENSSVSENKTENLSENETRGQNDEPNLYSVLSDICETTGGKKLLRRIKKLALSGVDGDEKRAERLTEAAKKLPVYKLVNLSAGELDFKFAESCLAKKESLVESILKQFKPQDK